MEGRRVDSCGEFFRGGVLGRFRFGVGIVLGRATCHFPDLWVVCLHSFLSRVLLGPLRLLCRILWDGFQLLLTGSFHCWGGSACSGGFTAGVYSLVSTAFRFLLLRVVLH